jgi:cation diffusion facilitator CzcD-associated flavoprotein CzcO
VTVEQRPAGRRRAQRIAILGAGAGGICTAIALQRAGWRDFTLFEKAAGVGGTWWHNRYPGAECDVESHLYSFSFEPKLDWTRPYAGQAEIQAYLAHCVAKYGLAPHLRLGHEVRRAAWDEARAVWRLETAGGEAFEADVVVSAIGMFNELHEPEIPGLDAFRGTRFHSARWNHAHDLSGEAVAVIGSAASAVQFVPEIAKRAGRLHVFQRSANWVLPKDDTPFTPEQLERFATDPSAARERREQIRQRIESLITFSDPELMRSVEEACLRNLEAVRDPSLRRRLTPTEPYGCKRPLLTNHYYPAFNRANVELVTDPIERITADAVVTRDGRARRVDALVLATGFETTKFLSAIDVRGRGGLRIEDAWKDGAQAYLGVATAGFPNLFMLYGPNTNNGSILFMLECQVACALRQLARLDDERLAWLDVRRSAMDRYNAELQRDIGRVSVWQTGCHNYYRSASGRIVTQWPHTMAEYAARTCRPNPDAWEAHPSAR